MPSYSSSSSLGGSIETGEITDDAVTEAKIGIPIQTLVEEIVIAGSDTNEVDFTGLDINTDGMYFVYITLKSSSAGNTNYEMGVNGDVTVAHYHRQLFRADSTSVTATRANNGLFANSTTNGTQFIIMRIMRNPIDSSLELISETTKGVGPSALVLEHIRVRGTETLANITQLNLFANQADGFKIGSIFRLYKLQVTP